MRLYPCATHHHNHNPSQDQVHIRSQILKVELDHAQVTEDTEEMRFNTAISGMMEFVNGAQKWKGLPPRAGVEPFVLLLAPYAPHLAEELWQVRLTHPAHLSFNLALPFCLKALRL